MWTGENVSANSTCSCDCPIIGMGSWQRWRSTRWWIYSMEIYLSEWGFYLLVRPLRSRFLVRFLPGDVFILGSYWSSLFTMYFFPAWIGPQWNRTTSRINVLKVLPMTHISWLIRHRIEEGLNCDRSPLKIFFFLRPRKTSKIIRQFYTPFWKPT